MKQEELHNHTEDDKHNLSIMGEIIMQIVKTNIDKHKKMVSLRWKGCQYCITSIDW